MQRQFFIGFVAVFTLLWLAFSSSQSIAAPKNQSPSYVGPALGTISSPFGWRRDPFKGTSAFHAGIDIAANTGTPVYALQEGYVVFAGNKGGYGKTVVIKHQYADIPEMPVIETLYAHNSRLLAKKGAYVRRGDVIALIGSTGRSTGPHLHFEVHYNNGYVNPIDYLVKLPSYLKYVKHKRTSTIAKRSTNNTLALKHSGVLKNSNIIIIED